jgi:hypothetical protein
VPAWGKQAGLAVLKKKEIANKLFFFFSLSKSIKGKKKKNLWGCKWSFK